MSKPSTAEEYLNQLPEEKKEIISKIRQTILANIPKGFVEMINYGMLGYVVPHSIYPDGYHCNTKLPLPFINVAAQKNTASLYHLGLYADEKLMNWFVNEYPKHTNKKLDMGKSCIRFKYNQEIPYALLKQLFAKMSVKDWMFIYEQKIKN